MSPQVILDALERASIDYDEKAYQPDKTFDANGIDSLDVMNLFLEIEEQFEIEISEDDAEKIRTPADLLAHVSNAVQNP